MCRGNVGVGGVGCRSTVISIDKHGPCTDPCLQEGCFCRRHTYAAEGEEGEEILARPRSNRRNIRVTNFSRNRGT